MQITFLITINDNYYAQFRVEEAVTDLNPQEIRTSINFQQEKGENKKKNRTPINFQLEKSGCPFFVPPFFVLFVRET